MINNYTFSKNIFIKSISIIYTKMYDKGGKVLASGGFGCVFSPALKCQGKTKRAEGKISKLMSVKHAKKNR